MERGKKNQEGFAIVYTRHSSLTLGNGKKKKTGELLKMKRERQ